MKAIQRMKRQHSSAFEVSNELRAGQLQEKGDEGDEGDEGESAETCQEVSCLLL
jgi:hypothetical protein